MTGNKWYLWFRICCEKKKIHDNAVIYRFGVDVKVVMKGIIWFVGSYSIKACFVWSPNQHSLQTVICSDESCRKTKFLDFGNKNRRWSCCLYFYLCWIRATRYIEWSNLKFDTSCMPPVSSAQYILRAEKTFNACRTLVYVDEDYPQGFDQKEEAFSLRTKYIESNSFHPITTSAPPTPIIMLIKLITIYIFSIYVLENFFFGFLKFWRLSSRCSW